MNKTFAAPWAASLKVISLISTILLPVIVWSIPWPNQFSWGIRIGILSIPIVLLGTCALFTVRGYELAGGVLKIQRLFWKTCIPLHSLADAEVRPGSFGWAIRTFGNGGLYSFSGWYYQKSLGSFRALATRTSDAVILKFNDRKPIVITPENPGHFVEAVRARESSQRGS